jgi:hypothetical protein
VCVFAEHRSIVYELLLRLVESPPPRTVRDAESGRPIAIRRRDRTVAYILSQERLEAIVDTMELLASPAARETLADHRAGRIRFLPLSALDER